MSAELSSKYSVFEPRFILKNRHIQSILASSHLIEPLHRPLLKQSTDLVIHASAGSKLLANVTPHPSPRGKFIILHGWEGSSSSAYVLSSGSFFYKKGFSICRLNLRDHGESHHLNEGLFHGALLDEVFDAVCQIAKQTPDIPLYILGFSLGANFSLRIAMKHTEKPIQNLKKIFAVSPPLDPYKTTLAIDNGPSFYRKYFMKKWKRSLLKKQILFPHKYDFTEMFKAQTCLELTAEIMKYYPEFPSYRDYFKLYTLNESSLKNIDLPVMIFISVDDPVIPWEDFLFAGKNRLIHVLKQSYGGHCGFIDFFPYRRWYQDVIVNVI